MKSYETRAGGKWAMEEREEAAPVPLDGPTEELIFSFPRHIERAPLLEVAGFAHPQETVDFIMAVSSHGANQ